VYTNLFTCATYEHYITTLVVLEEHIVDYCLLIATVYIILMQLGFTLLISGQVRKRNQMNVISKVFFDICVTSLGFFMFGYAFSTNADGGVIGSGDFFA